MQDYFTEFLCGTIQMCVFGCAFHIPMNCWAGLEKDVTQNGSDHNWLQLVKYLWSRM